ncbi:putative DOPA-like domain-containing protein [Seiridium cardinale]
MTTEYATGFKFPSPLAGFEDAPPLPDEKNKDKSYVNPPRESLSKSYEEFVEPLDRSPRGAFDVHIYYMPANQEQATYARELWERIRREFPELSVYTLWDKPIGPHPVAMFEVNIYSPAQFGAFIPCVATIDTLQSYGNSEATIGQVPEGDRFKIATKWSPPWNDLGIAWDTKDQILSFYRDSIEKLKVNQVRNTLRNE